MSQGYQVKTIDLIKAIKDGSYHKSMISPNDIEPGKIMGIRDFDVLKEIAIHRNDFEILRNTDTWPKRDDRQFCWAQWIGYANFFAT